MCYDMPICIWISNHDMTYFLCFHMYYGTLNPTFNNTFFEFIHKLNWITLDNTYKFLELIHLTSLISFDCHLFISFSNFGQILSTAPGAKFNAHPYAPRHDFNAMDCTDIVIGSAVGKYSRIWDYYTRDRYCTTAN